MIQVQRVRQERLEPPGRRVPKVPKAIRVLRVRRVQRVHKALRVRKATKATKATKVTKVIPVLRVPLEKMASVPPPTAKPEPPDLKALPVQRVLPEPRGLLALLALLDLSGLLDPKALRAPLALLERRGWSGLLALLDLSGLLDPKALPEPLGLLEPKDRRVSRDLSVQPVRLDLRDPKALRVRRSCLPEERRSPQQASSVAKRPLLTLETSQRQADSSAILRPRTCVNKPAGNQRRTCAQDTNSVCPFRWAFYPKLRPVPRVDGLIQ